VKRNSGTVSGCSGSDAGKQEIKRLFGRQPDKVETRLGTLEFKDGAPSSESVSKIYDNLDFTHAFDAFQNTLQGVSLQAARKGLQSIGVQDNELIVYSQLMDAKSLDPFDHAGRR